MFHSITFQMQTLKPFTDHLSPVDVSSVVEVKYERLDFFLMNEICFAVGWLTKFSQLSFTNVLNRGNFRWSYDGLYEDEDGTLSNSPGSIVWAPDNLWNTSNLCTPTPNFVNAITCPASLGSWIRLAFNQASLGQNGEVLNVYDSSNHHTVVLNLHKRLTHPNGYMMNLLAKRSYLFQFQTANVSRNLLK